MGDPRPDKVAVVDEVREKFESADGAMLTEYRGLNVPALAALRVALREAGGEYKISGAFQAPMAKLAGLLSALPRDFAYGLQALIEKGGAGDAPATDTASEAVAEAAADTSDDDAGDDAGGDDTTTEEE